MDESGFMPRDAFVYYPLRIRSVSDRNADKWAPLSACFPLKKFCCHNAHFVLFFQNFPYSIKCKTHKITFLFKQIQKLKQSFISIFCQVAYESKDTSTCRQYERCENLPDLDLTQWRIDEDGYAGKYDCSSEQCICIYQIGLWRPCNSDGRQFRHDSLVSGRYPPCTEERVRIFRSDKKFTRAIWQKTVRNQCLRLMHHTRIPEKLKEA